MARYIYWDDPHLEMLVEFKDPPELEDIGAVRKIIEMANAKKLMKTDDDGLHLVSRGSSIDGIGRLKELEGKYDRYQSNVFVVRFTVYYRWELMYKDDGDKDGSVMMQVINGVPSRYPPPPGRGEIQRPRATEVHKVFA
jgi:sensor domain DACNH-containing protein